MSYDGEIGILIKYSAKRESLLGNIKGKIEYEEENEFRQWYFEVVRNTLDSLMVINAQNVAGMILLMKACAEMFEMV